MQQKVYVVNDDLNNTVPKDSVEIINTWATLDTCWSIFKISIDLYFAAFNLYKMYVCIHVLDGVDVVEVSQFADESSVPIFLDQLHCTGNENRLVNCTFSLMHMCSYQHNIGIICQRKYQCMCYGIILIIQCFCHFVIKFLSAASECDVNNGGCEHYCMETIESYTCSCYPGYTLDSNGHSCTGMYID